jgi:hypothetical protein
MRAYRHSDALHVVERLRRTNFGNMQLTITYTDPKTCTKPFNVTLPVFYQADDDLIENVCLREGGQNRNAAAKTATMTNAKATLTAVPIAKPMVAAMPARPA